VSDPLGPVVITAREIYDQLVRVVAGLERLTSKHDDQTADLKDHETRLRSLERARWPLPALAVIVALASLALTFVRP
jgi:hypothetical protein